MLYTEDSSEPVYPLNTTAFNITDDDNVFLLIATVEIENSQDIVNAGITDRLSVPQHLSFTYSEFTVEGNGTTRIEITASGPRRLFTFRSDFVEYLRQVNFESDDQYPYVVRNLTVTVQEIHEIISKPTTFYIQVIPVNDRPVLLNSTTSEASLDSYLPQETNNLGFNASFLLSETDVDDVDRNSPIAKDFIGLAIIAEENGGLGVWEYWLNGSWVYLPAVNECSPSFLRPDQRVRFLPAASYSKMDGSVSFTYRAWDGTSSSLECTSGVVEITDGMSNPSIGLPHLVRCMTQLFWCVLFLSKMATQHKYTKWFVQFYSSVQAFFYRSQSPYVNSCQSFYQFVCTCADFSLSCLLFIVSRSVSS